MTTKAVSYVLKSHGVCIRVWQKLTLPILMITEVTVGSRWGKLSGICDLPAS